MYHYSLVRHVGVICINLKCEYTRTKKPEVLTDGSATFNMTNPNKKKARGLTLTQNDQLAAMQKAMMDL